MRMKNSGVGTLSRLTLFTQFLTMWLFDDFGKSSVDHLEEYVHFIHCSIDGASIFQAGDNVGLLIRGLKRDEVQRGQVCISLAVAVLSYS